MQQSEFVNVLKSNLLAKASLAVEVTSSKQRLTISNLNQKALHILADNSNETQRVMSLSRLMQFVYQHGRSIVPEESWLIFWHSLIIFIILYFFFEIALLLGYGIAVWNDELRYMYVITFIFAFFLLLDIVISPLKGIYLYGHLVMKKETIRKEYLKINFWIDLIGLIGVIIPYIHQGYKSNYLKLLFLPKVYTLYYLELNLRNQLKTNTKIYLVYSITRIVILMTMISHYIGIGFYIVDFTVYSNNTYGPNTPNMCWIYNAMAYSQMVLDLFWYDQYIYTMYFSLATMTTIAYGDITPLNPAESVYVIIGLTIYALSIGYFLYEILEILFYSQSTKFQFLNVTQLIAKLIQNYHLPQSITTQLSMQIEQSYSEERYRNRTIQSNVIRMLPLNLKYRLLIHANHTMLNQIGLIPYQIQNATFSSFLDNLNSQQISPFLLHLMSSILEERIFRGETIYEQGESFLERQDNHGVYFNLTKGANVTMGIGSKPNFLLGKAHNNPRYQLAEIEQIYQSTTCISTENSLVGLQEFFTGSNRSLWAVNNTNTKFYVITHKSLRLALMKANFLETENVFVLKQNIEKRQCYICKKKQDHSFRQCPFVTYQPNKAQLQDKFVEHHQKQLNQLYVKIDNRKSNHLHQQKNTYKFYSQHNIGWLLFADGLRNFTSDQILRKQPQPIQQNNKIDLPEIDYNQVGADILSMEQQLNQYRNQTNQTQRNFYKINQPGNPNQEAIHSKLITDWQDKFQAIHNWLLHNVQSNIFHIQTGYNNRQYARKKKLNAMKL